MKHLVYIFNTLRHNPGTTLIKVLSLGLGMAMCVFLLDMFLYIVNFDKSYRQSSDIYQIWMQYSYKSSGEVRPQQEQCYGPTARLLYENFPEEIESAVSTTYRGSVNAVYNNVEHSIGTVQVADSLFFETLGIEVIAGNPRKDLMSQDAIYLCEEVAKDLFGSDEPIGKTINILGIDATVRGVYKRPPMNSSVRPAAVLSFPSFWNRDWVYYGFNGGDSYPEYIRINSDANVDIDDLNRRIGKLCDEMVPQSSNTHVNIFIRPLSETNSNNPSTKTLLAIAVILGTALLLVTALNYALMSIASLSKRAKAVGVHKCNGASAGSIAGMFMLETAVILLLAACVAAIVLYYTQKYIETIDYINVRWILTEYRWSIVAVFAVLLLLGGLPPARLFSRIPVTQVFRRFTENHSLWKKALLFVQFAGITFVCCLLCIVSVQYNNLLNHDQGYDPSHLIMGRVNNVGEHRQALKDYISHSPYVEKVSRTESIPVYGYSGQFIWNDNHEVLFSTRINWASSGFVDATGMRLLAGRDVANTTLKEAVVNEEFMRRMHWNVDSAFAGGNYPEVNCGERVKVVGVVQDFVIGDFMQETMPYMSINIPSNDDSFYTLVLKVKDPVASNAEKLASEIPETFSGVTAWFSPMQDSIIERYAQVRFFRTIIIITSIIIVFIVLMGLIGFVRDEIQRRAKEIAIRKVNGAGTADIIGLLCRDIALVSVPAVAVGVAAAWWAGSLWLERFHIFPGDLPLYYILSGAAVLILIMVCVALLTARTALDNPIDAIKSE